MITTSQDRSDASPRVQGRVHRWREDLEPQLKELKYTLHLLRQSPLVILGTVLISIFILAAILAPWITPYGPEERIWTETARPPSLQHLFGTDEIGGDIFSRTIWAARVDLTLALTVVAISVVIGSIMGAVSGFVGGRTDEILMRVTDIFLAFPALILAMSVAAALGRTLQNLAIALIVGWWPTYARLIRGQVLAEKERLYVEAARAVGASTRRVIFRHVLPNSIYPLIVHATLDLGVVILVAAGLSFIGFGVTPGMAEWGRMVADGRDYIYRSPWIVTFPGLAILLASLGLNLVGDGLRDVLDPRLRR